MIDDKNQTLRFQYNRLGKPIKIVLESVGTLNVEYDDYGEITTVNSDEGHKMALKITMMFQNLLSLTKPSGVNFNL
jgi:YD repeat-containing protein